MKMLATATLLAALSAPALGAQHEEPQQPLPGLPDRPLVALVLIIPASLWALGEFWTRVCEASGNTFYQGDDGLWTCSGFPRPPSG